MPQSEVLVNFPAIQQGVGDIRAGWNNISAQLDDLRSYLAPMRSTWTGQARDAYDSEQAKWDAAAADLTQILNRIGLALQGAHDDFTTGETRNTGLF